ncbi:MAG: M50 family metallopeptidase, partial [Sciscionella sp.]
RYFIGFGPKVFSFRRGETEYGLKIIPAGGFCDIAGMTNMDEVTPEEAPKSMWRFPTWKRVVVLSAGSVTHFILGFLVLYFLAVSLGLPNTQDKPVIGRITPCAQTAQLEQHGQKKVLHYLPCAANAPAPAKSAGMMPGDTIVSVAGQSTPTWTRAVQLIQQSNGPTPVVVRRGGRNVSLRVNVARVTNVTVASEGRNAALRVGKVGAIGAGSQTMFHYNVASAFGGAGAFTGGLFVNTWEGLKRFPEKVPELIKAISGGKRDPNTPVSVVGASRIGGQLAEQGVWSLFWVLLASLNFFVGVFNLLPLLPLDGGHIAIVLYERVRDWLRKLRGLRPGGPVDYAKLTAVTLVFIVIGGAVMLLTITADIVNPIKL